MERATRTFTIRPRRRVVGGPFGDARSFRRDAGFEQIGTHVYDPNWDDFRSIDWPASARDPNPHVLIAREELGTQSMPVVIITDRAPSMAGSLADVLPGTLPKHDVVIEAGCQVADSAILRHSGVLGYRDFAHGGEAPFRRRANGKTQRWKVKERYLTHRHFRARPGQLAEHLKSFRSLPGAVVFVFSDFTDETLLEGSLWHHLLLKYDPVPVLVQDPVWEMTFPKQAAGLRLRLQHAAQLGVADKRISTDFAQQQKVANENRLARIRKTFIGSGLDWVELDTANPETIQFRFEEWSSRRRIGGGR